MTHEDFVDVIKEVLGEKFIFVSEELLYLWEETFNKLEAGGKVAFFMVMISQTEEDLKQLSNEHLKIPSLSSI